VQVRGGEERLGTDTSCTAGTASVRMQEDGRHVKGNRTGSVAVQACDDDAEWFNAGPILFSSTSHLEKRLTTELLMPRTGGR
jgi:hypothetical protein